MTHNTKYLLGNYAHGCGASYSRTADFGKPKRYQINTCYKCYAFMDNTDGNGQIFRYKAIEHVGAARTDLVLAL